ncbi:MAG: Holliday junction ATP-dependent DNA helicase RuvA [Candidatus Babeliales bacterium]|nr:Holliday junction ATP-dependent DNA helicase RuvA [Candidatus Babeliales bacterium]
MISYLKGTLIGNKNPLTLLINPGMGFEINVPNANLLPHNNEVGFYTHLHWNPEQGPTLFGFLTEAEKQLFMLAISCSGVGPKLGLTILSELQPQVFIRIINEQDHKGLSAVHGIGAKKAEQIIMQLKHKISGLMDTEFENLENKHLKNINDVLNSLNYNRTEITHTLDFLRKNHTQPDITFDQMLRHALSFLSKRP